MEEPTICGGKEMVMKRQGAEMEFFSAEDPPLKLQRERNFEDDSFFFFDSLLSRGERERERGSGREREGVKWWEETERDGWGFYIIGGRSIRSVKSNQLHSSCSRVKGTEVLANKVSTRGITGIGGQFYVSIYKLCIVGQRRFTSPRT